MSLGCLVVKGKKEAAEDKGPREIRKMEKQKKDKFCSHHCHKKYHLLKNLHFIVATEEGAIELRET